MRWICVLVVAGCGTDTPPKPEIRGPLKAWMEVRLEDALATENFAALATAFDELADTAPAGYPRWESIARDGARSAETENLAAVRAVCSDCHRTYRSMYRLKRTP
jgi:hypothetical protein